MDHIQPVRSPEHRHEKRCLANAIINAVENTRDLENMTDYHFNLAAQDNDFLADARSYLENGDITCLCGPCRCCARAQKPIPTEPTVIPYKEGIPD